MVARGARGFFVLIGALLACGCDPDQDPAVWNAGPAFLIVGRAAEQPTSSLEGINVYAQARADTGNYLGLVTYGGTHRYGNLKPLTQSCTAISGSRPLYFLVQPEGDEVVVEARLYNMVDELDTTDLSTTLEQCASNGALVTTASVPIRWLDGRDASGALDDASLTDSPSPLDALWSGDGPLDSSSTQDSGVDGYGAEILAADAAVDGSTAEAAGPIDASGDADAGCLDASSLDADAADSRSDTGD